MYMVVNKDVEVVSFLSLRLYFVDLYDVCIDYLIGYYGFSIES